MNYLCASMIELLSGDITKLQVDAIVNAANSTLLGGGGVDGAIHRAAGKELLEECKQIRRTQYPEGLPTGEAVITKGYNLLAKFVIHTVGPIWRGGNNNEPELLKNAYRNSLKLANEKGLKSIAFPNISTGIYGFPKILAAEIAIKTVKDFLSNENKHLEKVYFVVFDAENKKIYEDILEISAKSVT